MPSPHFQLLTPALGMEVTGLDLRNLDESTFSQLRDAFQATGLLCIRDQNLQPADHIAFAQRFGAININRFFTPVPGHPQIAEVRKEPDQTTNIGGGWHTDHSYDEVPALGSILYALDVPAVGGDTLFASMAAAYAGLSPGLQRTLQGLRAVHSSRHVFGAQSGYSEKSEGRIGNADAANQDAVHPLVIAHPDTGVPLLYVNPTFTTGIEGWAPAESAMLLNFLYQHASDPQYSTRIQWRQGTLAMWDNRSTWHYALNDYHGQFRLMHRITVDGVPLEAAGG